MRKIMIEDDNMIITVQSKTDGDPISDYINNLIVPALIGLGFSEKLIAQYVVSEVL